ncbi:MAG: ROK family protein [Bryobacteraceae bacterium]|nr:ROK family protein [Bryobacterales bacterium]NUN01288.1 ROK family protein [Bryobacteraceae bacterium]
MNSVIAIDLGGTKTAMAVVDEGGYLHHKQKVPAARTLEGTIDQVAAYTSDAGITHVGLIVPGIYHPRNGTAWAPNLWGHDYVPLRDALQNRLSLRTAIASDRTGYVLGEQWLGVARGLSDVVFVAIGTGIGVGILAGGRIVEGAHGIAGSAGWMAIESAWKPEYGETGCWESEAAGPALAHRAGMPSAETVAAAARAGDEHALTAIAGTAEYLAKGIANLISVFDPELVVLGGGLMQAADLLLEPVRAAVPRWAQPVAAQLARIEKTRLGEDAGLLGAARLALLQTYRQD